MSQLIIVLGSPNDSEGNLYGVGLERCERAFRLWREDESRRFLLTGGFGEHFNTSDRPHAEYLQRRLVALGVPETSFLPFALSLNTLEDASMSKPITVESGARSGIVVTSDYHLERARFVFEREYAEVAFELSFVSTITDESRKELDYEALKAHEKRALQRLKAKACQSS